MHNYEAVITLIQGPLRIKWPLYSGLIASRRIFGELTPGGSGHR